MTIDEAIDDNAITINENLSHDFGLKYHVVQAVGDKQDAVCQHWCGARLEYRRGD